MTGQASSKGVDDIAGQHDIVTLSELVLAEVQSRALTRRRP